MKNQIIKGFILTLGLGLSMPAMAASAGGWSFGVNFGIASSDQEDMNKLVSRANSANTISTSQLGGSYELGAFFMYRFSGIFAIQFRPSYVWASQTGEKISNGDDYNYSISGFTFMPILRMYLLENEFVKFFTQVGIGYGNMSGDVKEAASHAKFSGGSMGYLGGLGAEFCFTKEHCMMVEGDFRYLPVERMNYSSNNGGFAELQNTTGEVEIDNRDFSTTFSGIMGVLGYTMYF